MTGYALVFIMTFATGEPIEIKIDHTFTNVTGCVAARQTAFNSMFDQSAFTVHEYSMNDIDTLTTECVPVP